MNIILTGASGFIGTALLKKMDSSSKIDPIILLRSDSKLKTNILNRKAVIIRYSSLHDDKLLDDLRRNTPDVFIHLAWSGVSGNERNELFQITKNIQLTIDAVELAAQCGCKQFIGIGSQAEYGTVNKKITEADNTYPSTIYGKAKLSSHYAASGLCQFYKILFTWIRVFSTYGPNDDPKWFIPYIITEIINNRIPRLTKCEQQWDYLFVDDAADGILSLANLKSEGIFNLGFGESTPLKKIVQEIISQLHTTIQPEFGALSYRKDQIFHLEADIAKIKQVTGWTPSITIEEGLKRTISGYSLQ